VEAIRGSILDTWQRKLVSNRMQLFLVPYRDDESSQVFIVRLLSVINVSSMHKVCDQNQYLKTETKTIEFKSESRK